MVTACTDSYSSSLTYLRRTAVEEEADVLQVASRVRLQRPADLAVIVPHVRVRRVAHVEQAAQRTLG